MTNQKKTGVWILGGRGDIAVTTMASIGVLLNNPNASTTALLTEQPAFASLSLEAWDQFVFGGYDLSDIPLDRKLEDLIRQQVFPPHYVEEGKRFIMEHCQGNICKPPEPISGIAPQHLIDKVAQDLKAFQQDNDLGNLIMINLTSTEPYLQAWQELLELEPDAFAGLLEDPLYIMPPGLIYAYTGLSLGFAYINFTPNLGMDVPALAALAQENGLPHAGKDGKTGETLIKSALAPMFEHRALDVLSWQGYNMLGNGDGRTLNDPASKKTKIKSKDKTLRMLLEQSQLSSSGVSIDYVPSLGAWKTAWDFIHFEGFLGTKMTMQFTWQGCDTMLAAPLVLDLMRLMDRALRQQESGHLSYLDGFFKSPTQAGPMAFAEQMRILFDHLPLEQPPN
jgi:myo-inositol-1-phosphate synthase